MFDADRGRRPPVMTDALAAVILLGLVEGPLAPPGPQLRFGRGRVCPGCRRPVEKAAWPCRNHECPRVGLRD